MTLGKVEKRLALVSAIGQQKAKLLEEMGAIQAKGVVLEIKMNDLRNGYHSKMNLLAGLEADLRRAEGDQLNLEKARMVLRKVDFRTTEFNKTRKRTKGGDAARKRQKNAIDLLTNKAYDDMVEDDDDKIVETLPIVNSAIPDPSSAHTPYVEDRRLAVTDINAASPGENYIPTPIIHPIPEMSDANRRHANNINAEAIRDIRSRAKAHEVCSRAAQAPMNAVPLKTRSEVSPKTRPLSQVSNVIPPQPSDQPLNVLTQHETDMDGDTNMADAEEHDYTREYDDQPPFLTAEELLYDQEVVDLFPPNLRDDFYRRMEKHNRYVNTGKW